LATLVTTVVAATIAITAALAAATVVATVTRYFDLYHDAFLYWNFLCDLNWNTDLVGAGLFFRNAVIKSYRIFLFFFLWNHDRVGNFLGHCFRYTLANFILTGASLSSTFLYLHGTSSLFWNTLGDTVGASSLFFTALLYLYSACSLFWDTLGDAVGASSLFWNTLGDTVGTSSLLFTTLWNAHSTSSFFRSALANTNGIRNFFSHAIVRRALNFLLLTRWHPNTLAAHFWWARIATRICTTGWHFGHLVFPMTTTNLNSLG